jgi:Secretion system C-terminal sorting domain/CARDB
MKFKFTYFIFPLLLANLTLAQDNARWNSSTVVMANGNYVPLPQQPYVHPVTEPRKVSTKDGDVLVFPNIRVLPGPTSQTEVPLTISRVNQLLMFGSSNAVLGSTLNSGSYITTDGGNTWFGTNTINNGNTTNQRGDPGPIYGANSRIIFTHLSSASNFGNVTGMAAEYSTDFGVTFSASVQVHNNGFDDKNLAGADDVPTSPFYGNFYMAFCDYNAGTSFCARTTNGGVSWVAPVSWAPPAGLFAQGHDVTALPNGNVIVCYTLHGAGSPYTETGVGIGRSTDGGVTFTPNQPAYATNGSRSASFNGWGIRTNGFPRMACDKSGGARNGWIYVVMSELNHAPAGSDADIVLHRSTDNGVTWSAGIRVNQDALNNGKVQFFPCVCVDENGGVNVAYYDNRNFPSVGDSATVFISRSLDGGNTWADIEVMDHHFRPHPDPGLSGGYMGDYIGCASGNGKVWAFWMDDKAGTGYNAWAGYILSGPPLAHDYACGPFLSMPPGFIINTSFPIKVKVSNVGSSAETSVPIKFFVDNVLTNITNLSLAAGAVDSVTNNWMTPGTAGNHTLMYVSALATDLDRTNDTARVTVNVQAPPPPICLLSCLPPTTYTPINGSPGPVGDDVGMTVPLGFSFNYKGTYYNQVWLCTNGFMIMGPTGTTAFTNDLCTTDPTALNMIAPFWDDLNTNVSGNIQYVTQGSAPSRVFIAQFTNVGFHSGTGNVTFQMKLWETSNVIEFIYGPAVNNPAATGSIGINAPPGGPGNFVSITPGSNCANTIISTSTCNNIVPYNIASGTYYGCGYEGITQNENTVPAAYSLEQNYPNPFNPSTQIQFASPKASIVKLVVYDLLGRIVKTLVNEYKEAGTYKVDFDGTKLASGVYFYKLESRQVGSSTGDFTAVKKMLLVK